MPIILNRQFLIPGLAALAFATILLPSRASAFWPFPANADAATDTFVPSSSTPTLQASVNIDPNPNKGLGAIQTSGNGLLADAGPSGTIADVVGATLSDRISIYVVRPGDTLSEIARMFDVSVNTVVWANNLSGRNVRPGDTLVILPISGIEHAIAKGDTLRSIAKKYGADAHEIAQFNGLDPEAPLAVGSEIIIPGGEPEDAPRPASKPRILGGSGSAYPGYYANPVPGGLITQGIHGWNGIDIGATRGTPIHAAAGGIVIIARGGGAWNGGYGNYIVITHDNGSQTLYSHLRSVIASSGQRASSGQVIGYMGATGRTTGVHLHFEVRGAANPFRACAVGRICEPQ